MKPKLMIEHYTFGSIKIDGKEYTHDVIVSGKKVKSWWRATSHEVTINDLEPILEENPKLIIFGTGASGVCKVLEETKDYLSQLKVKFVIEQTPTAVKEFNQRGSEAGVVGAFHLTC
ncbi:MAG: Mth938-like domain-containing protein [Candidatus Margulisiibacteriota bacterium]